MTTDELDSRALEAMSGDDIQQVKALLLKVLPLATRELERRQQSAARQRRYRTNRPAPAPESRDVTHDDASDVTETTEEAARVTSHNANRVMSRDVTPVTLPPLSPPPLSPSPFSPTPPLTTPSLSPPDSPPSAATARERPTGLEEHFADDDHREAYLGYRRSAHFPDGFDAAVRTLAAPITGAQPVAWPTIGAALLEMRATGATFSPAALRAFCRRLETAPAPDGTASASGTGPTEPEPKYSAARTHRAGFEIFRKRLEAREAEARRTAGGDA